MEEQHQKNKKSLHSESLRQMISKTNFTQLKNGEDFSLILTPISQSKTSVEGIQFKIKNNYLMTSYENRKLIMLVFACQQSHRLLQNKTKIILWQFKKQDGQNRQMQICGIKGKVSCMRLDLVRFIQDKIQKEPQDNKVKYSFCLIIGTQQGYLKRIYLRKDYAIKSTKLSTLNPLRQILPLVSKLWQENVFYFLLLDNNQIILINIFNFDIICKFHPPILHCKPEYALNISLNTISSDLLFQSTKGGYLIVWDLSDQKIHKNLKASQNNSFKKKNILQMIFPKYLSHELSLNGFLFTSTFGQLVLIVDKKCTLKLISINFEDRMDFIQILEIQLPYFSDSEDKISENQEQEKFYDEDFILTYQNFKFSQAQMSLHFMLEKEKHSIYKLKLNNYMQCQQLQRFKIGNKSFKQLEQFIISQDGQFLIVRNKDSFAIKYFGGGESSQGQQQNQKHNYNRQKSQQKKQRKSQKKD